MTKSRDIECEIRTFVTDGQYAALLEKFGPAGEADEQITYYFEGHGNPDLRIQRNGKGAKVWMKKGEMHDEARQEIEIPCRGEDFGRLEALFTALGYRVSIKWFRKRRTFETDGIVATLDDTKGYGKILELEKLCAEDEREATLEELKAKLAELGVPTTPKEEFARRYEEYKRNWRELTGEA